jgi:hypothetical protein
MEEIRNEKSAADNITGCKVKGRALLNMVQELTRIREMSRIIKSANWSEIDAPVDKSKSRSMSSPSVKTFQMQPAGGPARARAGLSREGPAVVCHGRAGSGIAGPLIFTGPTGRHHSSVTVAEPPAPWTPRPGPARFDR